MTDSQIQRRDQEELEEIDAIIEDIIADEDDDD